MALWKQLAKGWEGMEKLQIGLISGAKDMCLNVFSLALNMILQLETSISLSHMAGGDIIPLA